MNEYVELILTAVVIVAEALIVNAYNNYLFSPKYSKLNTICAYALGYAVLLFIAAVFNNLITNSIAYMLVNLIIMYKLYACGLISAVFHSVVLTAFMSLSEVLSSTILSVYTHEFSSYQTQISVFVALTVISKMIYFLLCIISAKMFSPRKSQVYENNSMLKLCVLPMSSIIIADTIAYISMNLELPMDLQISVSVCLGVLFFANIYTIGIYSTTENLNRDNLILKLARQKDESNAEFYKMLQEQNEKQRILIHDVKNHMQIVNSLAVDGKTDEIQEYITKWGFDKAFQSQTRYSDNDTLNLVVTKLSHDCEENGIDLFCDIREQCVDFIDDIDVAALFGNLLTNAFESAVISDEKIIEIDIQIKPVQKMTIIRITNSCDLKPTKTNDGLFISSKTNKGQHGIGQKSIARIVKKYNGTAQSYYDENKKQFEWVIILPMI
ncbi:MAG: GHKL domain-containing protein [Oscillospiraceae bacterium]|nr:GHKL domain-containing protein [Oscillospiraceae bacterium]